MFTRNRLESINIFPTVNHWHNQGTLLGFKDEAAVLVKVSIGGGGRAVRLLGGNGAFLLCSGSYAGQVAVEGDADFGSSTELTRGKLTRAAIEGVEPFGIDVHAL